MKPHILQLSHSTHGDVRQTRTEHICSVNHHLVEGQPLRSVNSQGICQKNRELTPRVAARALVTGDPLQDKLTAVLKGPPHT